MASAACLDRLSRVSLVVVVSNVKNKAAGKFACVTNREDFLCHRARFVGSSEAWVRGGVHFPVPVPEGVCECLWSGSEVAKRKCSQFVPSSGGF